MSVADTQALDSPTEGRALTVSRDFWPGEVQALPA